MKKQLTIEGHNYAVPKHIAIIMDGNGRWAKQKRMPRSFGHARGSQTLEQICDDAKELGIEYITVYAFSTENWKRPKGEIETLMTLLKKYLKDSIKKSIKKNMRVRMIGDIHPLPNDIKERIENLEKATENCNSINLQIALNYGSRDEMIRAIKKIVVNYDRDEISIDEITQEYFSKNLDTRDIPDPDLLIRTSGEHRLSNFLLWQLAYAEFYFINKFWPDFNKNDLIEAIKYYNQRERRFGGIKTEELT